MIEASIDQTDPTAEWEAWRQAAAASKAPILSREAKAIVADAFEAGLNGPSLGKHVAMVSALSEALEGAPAAVQAEIEALTVEGQFSTFERGGRLRLLTEDGETAFLIRYVPADDDEDDGGL